MPARIRALFHRRPRVSAEYRKLAYDLEQVAAVMQRPGAVYRTGLSAADWTGR